MSKKTITSPELNAAIGRLKKARNALQNIQKEGGEAPTGLINNYQGCPATQHPDCPPIEGERGHRIQKQLADIPMRDAHQPVDLPREDTQVRKSKKEGEL